MQITADFIPLALQTIDEALQSILEERHDIASRMAGPVQFQVVARTGLVVVIAQQMRGGYLALRHCSDFRLCVAAMREVFGITCEAEEDPESSKNLHQPPAGIPRRSAWSWSPSWRRRGMAEHPALHRPRAEFRRAVKLGYTMRRTASTIFLALGRMAVSRDLAKGTGQLGNATRRGSASSVSNALATTRAMTSAPTPLFW